jgi:hypothetical protein
MGDWRDNPANNALSGRGEWWESPVLQDELMKQKLIQQGRSPEEIDQIMAQVKLAEGLKAKSDMTDPIAPMDTLTAQDNPALPVAPPQAPAQAPPQVSDQAAGAVSPSSPAPAATPEERQASLMDRLGPEGLELLLNQGGIDEQREQAMYLRNKEGPQGLRGIGRMNTYVAASPLSHLASGVEKYRAKKDIKRLREEEKEGNRTMLELLRGAEKKVEKDEDPDVGFGLGRVF